MTNNTKKKVLFVATVGSHIALFHMKFIKELKKNGYLVDAAFKDDSSERPNLDFSGLDNIYYIEFERSPLSLKNLKAYKQLRKLVNQNNYDIVHCNTPVGGVVGRLAANKVRKNNGAKVIYTAHGFHFYKGAPIINWLVYFPAEWLMSFKTDVLITINKEDYERAKKYMHAKHVEYIPGVGIDVGKFKNAKVDKAKMRCELGVPQDSKVLLSVGELSKRKNHQIVIRAIAKLDNPKIHYVVVGQGELRPYLMSLLQELNIYNQVHLVGFRRDIPKVMKACDVFVFPSKQEGLPVALMEAMATGMPCIASDVRGCRDLVTKNDVFDPCSHVQISKMIIQRLSKKDSNVDLLYDNLSNFSVETVNKIIISKYQNLL